MGTQISLPDGHLHRYIWWLYGYFLICSCPISISVHNQEIPSNLDLDSVFSLENPISYLGFLAPLIHLAGCGLNHTPLLGIFY